MRAGAPLGSLRLVDTVTGKAVSAAVSYSVRSRVAVINPTATLRAVRTYRVVVVAGIADWDGLGVPATSWKFTTAR